MAKIPIRQPEPKKITSKTTEGTTKDNHQPSTNPVIFYITVTDHSEAVFPVFVNFGVSFCTVIHDHKFSFSATLFT